VDALLPQQKALFYWFQTPYIAMFKSCCTRCSILLSCLYLSYSIEFVVVLTMHELLDVKQQTPAQNIDYDGLLQLAFFVLQG
jgi:hypothetical protein